MSHVVKFGDYPENVNKRKVQDEWDYYVQMEDWEEGASGANPIRWIECAPCEDYEAAEKYIEKHDKGWYDCLAVRYLSYEKVKPSAQIKELQDRVVKCRTALRTKETRFHFADVKSEFVGCKSCGSKISRTYMKHNYCPVCNADMRPASTLSSIDAAKLALEKAEKALAAEQKKYQQKVKNNAEVRWLVKVEFHQ